MRSLYVFALAFLLPGLLNAQKLSKDFEVTVSEPFKVVDAPSKEYFTVGDGMTISVKTRGEVVTIQKFDTESMKEVSRKEYKDFPRYNKVQAILQRKDKLLYVSEAYNKSERTFSVYAREIDTDAATFGKLEKLFTTDRPVSGTMSGFGQSSGFFSFGMGGNKFAVKQSKDGSRILIEYRLKPKEKRDKLNKDEIGIHVFDADLNELWGSVVTMPYTEAEMDNLAYLMASDGVPRILAYVRESKQYEWLSISEDAIESTPIDLPEEAGLYGLRMVEKEDGNVLFVGFDAYGYTMLDVSLSGQVDNWRRGEFSLDFITMNLRTRDQKKEKKKAEKNKAKPGIYDLELTDYSVSPDGGSVLVGERRYIVTTTYVDSQGRTRTKNTYYFTNVVVVKLDPEGEVVWMKKIPKLQKGGRGRGGMGIKYIRGKDAHYVLYLDNIKNNEIPIGRDPYSHVDGKGGFLTAVKIDHQTGDMERHPIFDVKDVKGIKAYQFNTERLFDISENAIMLETYIKGKKDAMIKLELNQ